MAVRKCDTCKRDYVFYRPTSRFCSTNCRVKNAGRPPETKRERYPRNDTPLDPDDPVTVLRERARAKREGDADAYAKAQARWDALPGSVTNPRAVER